MSCSRCSPGARRASASRTTTPRSTTSCSTTRRGKELVDLLDRAAKEFREGFHGDFRREMDDLEAKLAAGEVAEEMYFKKRKEIESRYKWVART